MFTIPFTVELMERVEETIIKCQDIGWSFLRIKKSDQSVRIAFEEFCRPYLSGIDLKKTQPTFCALFFSAVRNELLRSIVEWQNSTTSTDA